VTTVFIEPGSPWEDSYNESINGKLIARDPGGGRSSLSWSWPRSLEGIETF
jgi:hypothetical protein